MKSNYKRLGDYIKPVKEKNIDLKASKLLGINIDKFFMPSVANVIGTDMTNYKIVKKGQFACNRMHVGRDYRIPIALAKEKNPFMVSPAYDVFEITATNILLPEYLMMWFSRKEFDRNTWFHTDADVRGGLPWTAFCDLELPIPSLEKQQEIVREYNTIQNRIALNNQLIAKLEETAQAIYKQWFVDFEFPDENGKPYKSNGGKMVWCEELEKEIPEGWSVKSLGEIIDYKKGYAFKSTDYKNEGNEIIRVSDLGSKYVQTSKFYRVHKSKLFDAYKVKDDDFIITTVGSWPSNPLSVVGKIVRVPSFADEFYLNQNMVRIRFSATIREIAYQQLIDNSFSEYLISGAQGSANQASITLEHIFTFKIILPNELVVNDLLGKLYLKIELCLSVNQKLEELKELLLGRMVRES